MATLSWLLLILAYFLQSQDIGLAVMCTVAATLCQLMWYMEDEHENDDY